MLAQLVVLTRGASAGERQVSAGVAHLDRVGVRLGPLNEKPQDVCHGPGYRQALTSPRRIPAIFSGSRRRGGPSSRTGRGDHPGQPGSSP